MSPYFLCRLVYFLYVFNFLYKIIYLSFKSYCMGNACVIWGQLSLHHQRFQSSQGTLWCPGSPALPPCSPVILCLFSSVNCHKWCYTKPAGHRFNTHMVWRCGHRSLWVDMYNRLFSTVVNLVQTEPREQMFPRQATLYPEDIVVVTAMGKGCSAAGI